MVLEHPNIPDDIISKFLDRVNRCITNGDEEKTLTLGIDNLFSADFILVDREFLLRHGCKESVLKDIKYVIYIIDINADTYYESYTDKFEFVNPGTELFDMLDDLDHRRKYETHAIYDKYPHITTREYLDWFNKKNKYLKKLNESIKSFKDFIK